MNHYPINNIFSKGRVRLLDERESLSQAIQIILATNKRALIMNPGFGSFINKSLFDRITPTNIELLKINIIKAMEQIKDLKVEDIQVSILNHQIDCFIRYSKLNTNISDQIQMTLEEPR